MDHETITYPVRAGGWTEPFELLRVFRRFQTNGFVERFNRTVPDEFFRVMMRETFTRMSKR